MFEMGLTASILLLLGVGAVAAAAGAIVIIKLRKAAPVRLETHTIAERVRAVGKLVGLEVYAKEIATSTQGWAWIPPILLSQAKLAMIFHFQKQYFVDLRRLKNEQVMPLGPRCFRVTMPPIDGSLMLLDVTPYDIQDGRILGLLDVIPMNADRQKGLMEKAQEQAARLFERNDARYLAEARQSIERHLRALLELFDLDVEIVWQTDKISGGQPRLDTAEGVFSAAGHRG